MADREPVLGRSAEPADIGRLDLIPVEEPVLVRFRSAELLCLCPGVDHDQPDIYDLTIEFLAKTNSIESKSLKLWLTTFRNQRIFAEQLAPRIGGRIADLPGIDDVTVRLVQNIRGGIVETVEWPATQVL